MTAALPPKTPVRVRLRRGGLAAERRVCGRRAGQERARGPRRVEPAHRPRPGYRGVPTHRRPVPPYWIGCRPHSHPLVRATIRLQGAPLARATTADSYEYANEGSMLALPAGYSKYYMGFPSTVLRSTTRIPFLPMPATSWCTPRASRPGPTWPPRRPRPNCAPPTRAAGPHGAFGLRLGQPALHHLVPGGAGVVRLPGEHEERGLHRQHAGRRRLRPGLHRRARPRLRARRTPGWGADIDLTGPAGGTSATPLPWGAHRVGVPRIPATSVVHRQLRRQGPHDRPYVGWHRRRGRPVRPHRLGHHSEPGPGHELVRGGSTPPTQSPASMPRAGWWPYRTARISRVA